MASRRALVSATTDDALSAQVIRTINGPSAVNMWGSCVTVTDTVGLNLDGTSIMEPGTLNIHAAALGLVNISDDQLVFDAIIGVGDLRMPWVVTTSGIYILDVNPIA